MRWSLLRKCDRLPADTSNCTYAACVHPACPWQAYHLQTGQSRTHPESCHTNNGRSRTMLKAFEFARINGCKNTNNLAKDITICYRQDLIADAVYILMEHSRCTNALETSAGTCHVLYAKGYTLVGCTRCHCEANAIVFHVSNEVVGLRKLSGHLLWGRIF